MPNALIVVDKDTVDEAEALGRKFAKGQVRANEDTGELEFYDGANWNTYVGTLFATRALGDIIVRGTNVWQRFAIGVEGTFLRVSGGVPAWQDPNIFKMVVASGANAGIAAVADNQAGMTNPGTDALSRLFPEWLVEIASADNASISWAAEIHDPNHTILESFRFDFPADGVGTVHRVTSTLFALESFVDTGSYHLNTTGITLNGGTVTVLQRRMWGEL